MYTNVTYEVPKKHTQRNAKPRKNSHRPLSSTRIIQMSNEKKCHDNTCAVDWSAIRSSFIEAATTSLPLPDNPRKVSIVQKFVSRALSFDNEELSTRLALRMKIPCPFRGYKQFRLCFPDVDDTLFYSSTVYKQMYDKLIRTRPFGLVTSMRSAFGKLLFEFTSSKQYSESSNKNTHYLKLRWSTVILMFDYNVLKMANLNLTKAHQREIVAKRSIVLPPRELLEQLCAEHNIQETPEKIISLMNDPSFYDVFKRMEEAVAKTTGHVAQGSFTDFLAGFGQHLLTEGMLYLGLISLGAATLTTGFTRIAAISCAAFLLGKYAYDSGFLELFSPKNLLSLHMPALDIMDDYIVPFFKGIWKWINTTFQSAYQLFFKAGGFAPDPNALIGNVNPSTHRCITTYLRDEYPEILAANSMVSLSLLDARITSFEHDIFPNLPTETRPTDCDETWWLAARMVRIFKRYGSSAVEFTAKLNEHKFTPAILAKFSTECESHCAAFAAYCAHDPLISPTHMITHRVRHEARVNASQIQKQEEREIIMGTPENRRPEDDEVARFLAERFEIPELAYIGTGIRRQRISYASLMACIEHQTFARSMCNLFAARFGGVYTSLAQPLETVVSDHWSVWTKEEKTEFVNLYAKWIYNYKASGRVPTAQYLRLIPPALLLTCIGMPTDIYPDVPPEYVEMYFENKTTPEFHAHPMHGPRARPLPKPKKSRYHEAFGLLDPVVKTFSAVFEFFAQLLQEVKGFDLTGRLRQFSALYRGFKDVASTVSWIGPYLLTCISWIAKKLFNYDIFCDHTKIYNENMNRFSNALDEALLRARTTNDFAPMRREALALFARFPTIVRNDAMVLDPADKYFETKRKVTIAMNNLNAIIRAKDASTKPRTPPTVLLFPSKPNGGKTGVCQQLSHELYSYPTGQLLSNAESVIIQDRNFQDAVTNQSHFIFDEWGTINDPQKRYEHVSWFLDNANTTTMLVEKAAVEEKNLYWVSNELLSLTTNASLVDLGNCTADASALWRRVDLKITPNPPGLIEGAFPRRPDGRIDYSIWTFEVQRYNIIITDGTVDARSGWIDVAPAATFSDLVTLVAQCLIRKRDLYNRPGMNDRPLHFDLNQSSLPLAANDTQPIVHHVPAKGLSSAIEAMPSKPFVRAELEAQADTEIRATFLKRDYIWYAANVYHSAFNTTKIVRWQDFVDDFNKFARDPAENSIRIPLVFEGVSMDEYNIYKHILFRNGFDMSYHEDFEAICHNRLFRIPDLQNIDDIDESVRNLISPPEPLAFDNTEIRVLPESPYGIIKATYNHDFSWLTRPFNKALKVATTAVKQSVLATGRSFLLRLLGAYVIIVGIIGLMTAGAILLYNHFKPKPTEFHAQSPSSWKLRNKRRDNYSTLDDKGDSRREERNDRAKKRNSNHAKPWSQTERSRRFRNDQEEHVASRRETGGKARGGTMHRVPKGSASSYRGLTARMADIPLSAQGTPDYRAMINRSTVFFKNADGIVARGFVPFDRLVIMPHHYLLGFQNSPKLTVITYNSTLEVDFSEIDIASFPEWDQASFLLPATVELFPDLSDRFIYEDDLHNLTGVATMWLPLVDSHIREIVDSDPAGVQANSWKHWHSKGATSYNAYCYNTAMATSAGDCGSVLTVNQPSLAARTIVGYLVSGNGVDSGFTITTQERLFDHWFTHFPDMNPDEEEFSTIDEEVAPLDAQSASEHVALSAPSPSPVIMTGASTKGMIPLFTPANPTPDVRRLKVTVARDFDLDEPNGPANRIEAQNQHVVAVSNKQPIEMPVPALFVAGTSDYSHLSRKSRLKESKVMPYLQCTKRPAVLSRNESPTHEDPCTLAFYRHPPHAALENVDYDYLRLCAKATVMSIPKSPHRKILTPFEGIHGTKWLSSMDPTSSAGHYWNSLAEKLKKPQRKAVWMFDEKNPANTREMPILHPLVAEKIQAQIEIYESGCLPDNRTYVQLKDECVDPIKIATSKTRIYGSQDIDDTAVQRMYYGFFVGDMTKHRRRNFQVSCSVGFTPTEYHATALLQAAKNGRVYAGDQSGFDYHQYWPIAEPLIDEINLWYNDEHANVRKLIAYGLYTSLRQTGSTLARMPYGMPSGCSITTQLNSLYLEMCTLYAIGKAIERGLKSGTIPADLFPLGIPTPRDIKKVMFAMYYGDDSIFVLPTEWNITSKMIFETYKELGLEATHCIKDWPLDQEVPFEQMSFLKRSLSLNEDGIFTLRLPKEVIWDMLCFVKAANYDRHSNYIDTARNMLIEARRHSLAFFNEVYDTLDHAFAEAGMVFDLPNAPLSYTPARC